MKKFMLVSVTLIIATVLSGCGLKPPSEKELEAMIPQEILTYYLDGNEYQSSISQLEITRRQTNEKDDYAECLVDLVDSNLNRRVYISFTTKYYDKGGWMLEDWNIYKSEEYLAIENSCDTNMLAEKSVDICRECDLEASMVSETESENCVTMVFEVIGQGVYWSASGEVVSKTILTTDDDYEYPKHYIWDTEFDFSSVDDEWNLIGAWHGTPSSDNFFMPDTKYDVLVRINSLNIDCFDGQPKGVINLDVSGTRYLMGSINSITTDGKPVNKDVDVTVEKSSVKYVVDDYESNSKTLNITTPYLRFNIDELFYIGFDAYSGWISAGGNHLGSSSGDSVLLTRVEN